MPQRLVALVASVCLLTSCHVVHRHPIATTVTLLAGSMVAGGELGNAYIPADKAFDRVGAGIGLGMLAAALVMVGALLLTSPPHPDGGGDDDGAGGYSYDDPEPPITGGGGGCYAVGEWSDPQAVGEADLVAGDGQRFLSSSGTGEAAYEIYACMLARDNGWANLQASMSYVNQATSFLVYRPACSCNQCEWQGENGPYDTYQCNVTTQAIVTDQTRVTVAYGWGASTNGQADAQQLAMAQAEARVSCSGGSLTDTHVLGCQVEPVNQGLDSNGQAIDATEWTCGASARCDR